MKKRGPTHPFPNFLQKLFPPHHTIAIRTKLMYYFSGRKTLEMKKSASFTGVIQSFAKQKSSTWNPCINFFG
jgi:hypothetical protein